MKKELIGICGLIVLIWILALPEETEASSGLDSNFNDVYRAARDYSNFQRRRRGRRGHGRRPWRHGGRRGGRRGNRRRHDDYDASDSMESGESMGHGDPCSLRRNRGECYDSIERWYYNNMVGECRSFTYSGCKGNANKFISQKNCENVCGGGSKSASKETKDEEEKVEESKDESSSGSSSSSTVTETETTSK